MAKFCVNCGSPMNEGSAFCGACGARAAQLNVPQAASPVYPQPPVTPLPPVRQGASPLLKIILVVLVILLVLGSVSLFGVFYAFHVASRKAHEFSRQVLGSSGIDISQTDESESPVAGPGACRFLSKEDVSRAIGVAIVATKTTATGCEYLAHGTPAEMAGKHISAMMAAKGASAQQQQMIQNLSRGLLSSAQGESDGKDQDAKVNAVVMAFTIDPDSARTQMTLNQNVVPGGKPLEGIGDEAFDTAGSIMMVRKGDKLIRITYSGCPCTLNAIKPLAKRLAASL